MTNGIKKCYACQSTGSKSVKAGKSAIFQHKQLCKEAQMLGRPLPPMPRRVVNCDICSGLGVLDSQPLNVSGVNTVWQEPVFSGKICVIGGGIGGLAFALAGMHRGLDITVFEKDENFSTRSQGYALTMQQGFTQLRKLGFSIDKLRDIGTTSSCHVTLDTHGEIIGRTGRERWGVSVSGDHREAKRFNIQLPRQYLRQELLEAIPAETVRWGKKLSSFDASERKIYFTDNTSETYDLLVAADGIWSHFTLPQYPLTYLGVIVILGRGRVTTSNHLDLGVDKIWQTVDGVSRMYAMPFGIKGETMWQLSWKCTEEQALALGGHPSLLLEEAKRRVCGWHDPWTELLNSTKDDDVTGYPAYDRWPLPNFDDLQPRVAVLGDAAHPLSPFKGQGANQALADGVELATILCAGSDRENTSSKNQNHNLSYSKIVDDNEVSICWSKCEQRNNLKRSGDALEEGNRGKRSDESTLIDSDSNNGPCRRSEDVDHKSMTAVLPYACDRHDSEKDVNNNADPTDYDQTHCNNNKNDDNRGALGSASSDECIKHLIQVFHRQMLARVSVKVKQSREATGVLHSPAVLIKGDRTRGKLHDEIEEKGNTNV